MSNIRLTVADPIPMPRDFEDVTPSTSGTLVGAGLLQEGQVVLYLPAIGRAGEPGKGDFVFNCSAIYELTTSAIRLPCRRSSAEGAVGLGRDPGRHRRSGHRRPGHLRQEGAGVPSSGGANMFLVIDAAPDIRIGGV